MDGCADEARGIHEAQQSRNEQAENANWRRHEQTHRTGKEEDRREAHCSNATAPRTHASQAGRVVAASRVDEVRTIKRKPT